MKKIIALSAVVIGAVVLGGCSYGSSSYSSLPSNNMPSSANPTTSAVGNSVSIQNFAFNPGTLNVSKGTTVTWTNNDPTVHQIKSATFNSNQLSQGQTFSFTFNDAGTFDYSCAIHPSMMGKIVVQ